MQTILLVEDNELNRDMLGRRLKRRGYAVITAVDGPTGIAKAQSDQPDLILMDMSLPIMDGWSATSHLKADPQTATIPIIALTAHAMVGDRDQALAAGCDDYDTKPVEIRRLLAKVEALLVQRDPSQDQQIPVAETLQTPIPPSFGTTSGTIGPRENHSVPEAPAKKPLFPPEPIATASNKILIVDNAEENRDALSRHLSHKGYDIISASNRETALSILRDTDIALVLLTAVLPGIGGFEILRQIRQRHSLLELPIIMIEAQERGGGDIVRAFELGANDYIASPIDLSVLLVRIKTLLQTVGLSHFRSATVTAPQQTSLFPLGEHYRPIRMLTETPISQTWTAEDLRDSDDPLKLVQKIQLQISDSQVLETAKAIFANEIENLKTVRARDKVLLPIDAYEKDGAFYLINEYIEGSLFSIQTTEIQPGDLWKVIRLTDEILREIEPLHNCNIIHYCLSPSCFIIPKHRISELVLIDTGLRGRLLLKLQEIYPVEAFLSQDIASNILPISEKRIKQEQIDLCSIGIIAVQALTGKSDPHIFEPLQFNESRWSAFSCFDPNFSGFLKRLIYQGANDSYGSISSASRDLLKLWLNLNYSHKLSEEPD
jgi:DNA-binding response OmpR family regulator